MHSVRFFSILIFLLLAVYPAVPQNESAAGADQQPAFKSNVRLVLVDVAVTNSKDEPVTGLTKDKFEVLEDGKSQTLASFEEHAGIPDVPELSRMAKLPPNVFSNIPLAKAGEAANILLLDSLNTEMSDQSYVHAQMIRYLREIRPGTRMAIFTLSDRLRFVQGFTQDPALLMAAMNGKKSAGNPELSSLLQTNAEQNLNQQAISQMQEVGDATGSAEIQGAANALTAFLKENTESQTSVRVSRTLEAIDQLARYLQVIPGRKNVIWFTGSFPLNALLSDENLQTMRDDRPEVTNTANLLAAARIAIYPLGVGATGLAPNRMYDAATPPPALGVAAGAAEQRMTELQVRSLNQESTERARNNASLEELADNTGGQSFLNTNGFNDVLDRVAKIGTFYYTLTYSPTNRNIDGRLRHIQIKLSDARYHLAYRRGYYATSDFMAPALKPPINGDPLRPLMDHGTPDATGILYTMKVVPATAQPGTPESGAVSRRAGDNDKLSGTVTRYTVTFAIPPEHLALDSSADGVHHGSVEVTLLAYDRDGTPVNWMVRMVQVRVTRQQYALAQANGVGFNLDIDVPTSGVYLRAGLYDMGSNKAGTLEIPIAAVVASTAPTPDSVDRTPLPGDAASTKVPVPTSSVSPGPISPATLALAAAKELEAVDIPKYCSNIAGSQEHSLSLAAVCESVLNLRKQLSNIICDRKTRRYWTTPSASVGGADYIEHSDVVTVNVTYRNGQEFYSDVRVDGQPVPANAPELSGNWSHGEFATMLTGIFAPSSKAQFHYSKQT